LIKIGAASGDQINRESPGTAALQRETGARLTASKAALLPTRTVIEDPSP
jgi:hypothetical protein